MDVPIEFFNHAIRRRLKVSGALYLTMFGNPRARTIPTQGSPVDVLDGLRCSIGQFSIGEFELLSCGAAFRWPGQLIYAKVGSDGMIPFTRVVSYSPLPARD